jgi:hypothetical protein
MKNKMKAISLPSLLALLCWMGALSGGVRAQDLQRIELPVPGGSQTYQTIPVGQQGLILVSKPDRASYRVERLDTSFKKVWNIDGSIAAGLDFITSTYDGRSVYLLFGRSRGIQFHVVKVSIGPGFVETFVINTIDRFQLTDFKTLGYSVFMAGVVREEPLLMHTDLVSLQSRILPSAIKGSNSIQAIEVDTTLRVAHVSFVLRKGRQTRIVSRSYNELGELVAQASVDPTPDYSLLNGRLQMLNDSISIMIGTYGYRNMQTNSSVASQGLFITKFLWDQEQYTQYHSFTDFANFFNFMSDRQQEKMERKIQKRKQTGGDIKLNYRLLIHDLLIQGDELVLAAEVFYPEYRYQNPNMMGMSPFWGSPFMWGSPFGMGLWNPWLWNPFWGGPRGGMNNQIFDGFVYTHAIVAGFDANGKLKWDNSIPYNNVKSMELTKKVRVQMNGTESAQLLYSQNGGVKAMRILGSKVLDEKVLVGNQTGMEGDRVRKTYTDDVAYWYDNNYLSWGEQQIVNPGGDVQTRGRRTVYYLTKIAF